MAHLIPIDLIDVPAERQRKAFPLEEMLELQNDIESNGLINPITLKLMPTGRYTLVAGERRLRSMKDIWELGGHVKFEGQLVQDLHAPASIWQQMTELQQLEVEFSENVIRNDLTWQERAEAAAKLRKLRILQAEAKGDIIPPLDEELGKTLYPNAQPKVAADSASRDLVLARNLHRPEVRKATSAAEAIKVIAKLDKDERNAKLAAGLGTDLLARGHELHQANTYEWMKKQPSGQFDVILTDPPYGMGADEFGDSGGLAAGGHKYEDNIGVFMDLKEVFPGMAFRLTKPQAHLYCFCDFDKFPELRHAFSLAGWNVFRTPIIWHKPNGSRAPWPGKGPQRAHEYILFAIKGDMLVQRVAKDVISCPADENIGHEAQKPVPLFQELLSRSVTPGMRVLDPFGGSGPIIPAAHTLKCFATWVDKMPESYGMAAKRLEELK